MKRITTWAAAFMAVSLLSAAVISADPGDAPPDRPQGDRPDRERGPRGPFGQGFGPPPNPFMEALDIDKDGELSAEEIDNAVVALKSMDEDQDGKLSHDEVRPKRGDRGPGGPPREGRGPGGPPPEGRPERDPVAFVDQLMTHDEDGDGKLSEDELPERMQRIFTVADIDEDGFLTREELTEAAKKRQGGRKERGPGEGGGKGKGKGGGKKGNPPEATPPSE